MYLDVYSHRVRYNEVDEQGIVFNAHYLTWCDHALTEYFRENGWSPHALKTEEVDLVLRKVDIEYLSSAHLDDLILFNLVISKVGNTSFDTVFTIKLNEVILVIVKIVYVNVIDNSSKILPDAVRTCLNETM